MWEKNLGNVPIADVAVTANFVVVCAGSGDIRYWRFTHLGTMLVTESKPVGWHPRTDGRTVLYRDGSRFVAWTPGSGESYPPGKGIGNNATGISPAGIQFCQHESDGTFETAVYCGSVKVGSYKPTGIWEAHDDGTVRMMDDCNRPDYAPGAGGYAHRCGPVTVAEGANGGTVVYLDGVRRVLYGGTDAMWPRVSVFGDLVAVVSWGKLGTRLWVGTLDEVRALPLDVPPPVVVPPAPAHLKGCGYFFRDTNVHPYVAKYGGRNPAAPGTHSVIVDDHGLPAEGRADGSVPRMIVGLGQLLHPQLPGWWDRVDAVYVAVENDEAGLERYATVARYLMRELHLAPKPILSYSAGSVFPHALEEDDILGIQFYAPRGEGPDYFRRWAEAVWPQIQGRKRVAIIGQAYDRGGWFTGAELADMQPVLYEIASAWPNCEYLLWFSDARAGGTRDHEEMRPWHVAIADAITRNRQ